MINEIYIHKRVIPHIEVHSETGTGTVTVGPYSRTKTLLHGESKNDSHLQHSLSKMQRLIVFD